MGRAGLGCRRMGRTRGTVGRGAAGVDQGTARAVQGSPRIALHAVTAEECDGEGDEAGSDQGDGRPAPVEMTKSRWGSISDFLPFFSPACLPPVTPACNWISRR